MLTVAASGAERKEYVSSPVGITTFIACFSASCTDMRLKIPCRVAFPKLWEMVRLAVDGFLDSTSGYEILSSFGELVLLIFLKIRWMRQTRHSLKTLRPNRLTCHSNGMLLRGKKSTFQIPHKFWSVPNFSGTFGAHSVKHSASFPRKKNQVMWPDRPNENFPPPLV